jgi:hypothetical protein
MCGASTTSTVVAKMVKVPTERMPPVSTLRSPAMFLSLAWRDMRVKRIVMSETVTSEWGNR